MPPHAMPASSTPAPYAELHAHSSFSLLDGASSPEALVAAATALGYGHLALTDHDDLGGVVRFATAAAASGLQGIIGAEVTVDVREAMPRDARRAPEDAAPALTHLTLLAMSAEGYANLSRLITHGRMTAPRGEPRVPWAVLAAYSAGLMALSGCPAGWAPSRLAVGDMAGARAALGALQDVFADRCAVEVWDHALSSERALVRALLPLAARLGLPWVVTNNVHYATRRARPVHDVLATLRHQRTLDTMGTRLRPNAEWALRAPAAMAARWGQHPEGVQESLRIADRCRFRLQDLRPSLPEFPLPAGITADAYLAALVEAGASERWGQARGEAHARQLAHELGIIARRGLAGYFLIVWDIVRFARREGILCQGRGSAANSAVCYALGITAVDPIRMQLLFERFLSEERDEAPDIDIDFAHRDRERVLQYVYSRYGRDHAAMVCEQITFQGRRAARDVARVLGFSGDQADALADRLAAGPGETGETGEAGETGESGEGAFTGALAAAGLDPEDRRAQCVPPLVTALVDLPRHRSIHVGGMVLTREPLSTVVPIEPASMADRTVIQWEKDDLDPVGLIKIDLLGLGMLTVLQDCMRLVRQLRGVTVDLAQLDHADPAVYDLLTRADTMGVFQVESRAQMQLLPRLKPRTFYDLVVAVALIRPGPIQGDMVHPYLRRRAGIEAVTVPHSSLEPILRRTLGIPLFQEQGMLVAVACAGFTPGEADVLRKAMGHKRSRERMAAICQRLLDGMRANGIPDDVAQQIFNQINAFADYGFPESHAASFALLVYASAYFKCYYPEEFLAALLNAQPMGFYAPGALVQDARRRGVRIAPVDLRVSAWDTTVTAGAGEGEGTTDAPRPIVRLGLKTVVGLGPKAQARLETALAAGPFTSVEDVVQRAGLDRRALRCLAEAGAFDSMFPDDGDARSRRTALWALLEAARGAAGPLAPLPATPVPAVVPVMTPAELTAADYRTTGLTLNGHPVTHVRVQLREHAVVTAAALAAVRHGQRVRVAGLVICRQRPGTAKGIVFLTLEDETGTANVLIPPDRFAADREAIVGEPLVLVSGVAQVANGVVTVRATRVVGLRADAGEHWARSHDFH